MLISLKNVAVSLNHRVLLEDIHLKVSAGDVIRIFGANGAGKSTLLKVLFGDVWQTSGQRWYFLTDPPRDSPIGSREQMALISPEIQERFQRLAFDRTALEMLQTGFAQSDYLYTPLTEVQQQQVLQMAADCQLFGLLEQIFAKLSKGQMRQVLLARALLRQPKVLLLDEFFSGIDANAQQRLQQMVVAYLETGGTLCYTTHRNEATLGFSEQQVWLEQGKIVQSQPHQVNPPKAQKSAKKAKINARANLAQILVEMQNANVYLGEPRDDATALFGDASSGSRLILSDINLQLLQGQHYLLLGHNGAGKSTLARVIRGDVLPAVGGIVRWFGSSTMPIWERQARIALISSDQQAWHRVDATGFEIVASGLTGGIGWHRQLTTSQKTQVKTLLAMFEMSAFEHRNALHCSQGELRKLLIARALITNPELIILDEAFDYLDIASRQMVWQALENTAASLLIIAHRAEDTAPFPTHVMRLEAGQIVWTGSSSQLIWHSSP